jgi:hypothetical protein
MRSFLFILSPPVKSDGGHENCVDLFGRHDPEPFGIRLANPIVARFKLGKVVDKAGRHLPVLRMAEGNNNPLPHIPAPDD